MYVILSLSSIRDHTFGDSLCFNLSIWLVFVIVWPLRINVVHMCSLLSVYYIYFWHSFVYHVGAYCLECIESMHV